MAIWQQKQLSDFARADDFHVSPFYDDGKTFGTPTWIWSVVVGDNLYIRPWNGRASRWYQSAVKQGAGRIKLAGNVFQVEFEKADADKGLNQQISEAYSKKYSGSSYLPPMIAEGPTSATMKVLPK
ncbi:DUF2255 family protein [Secundilactobacillus paracollinoides]|uniref:DUF2255 domain-containing protein n=1 Tax=Secundilactobacillus paracollinoides TaxID=240427 RepID=A0A1B2J0Q1_9LACO|nr:DUF2255 family protein [Secundilactobacillus paracollinoides]ANZ61926.1 hypothetical protein AYR61_11575 [Secundilactobacillus paracollinoides]ANZ67872.1 hypothetical protein AYR63_12470 [Secundilactobacillus paracollinoides]KRL79282.1 hypothetical protein FC17_GL000547 [Secundilactobacillus paracollinoides DSM 15502 = JCM 11969]